jgi:enoyl-CoA hydratase/carnithine racemase
MPIRSERPAPHVELVTIDRAERANALDPPALRALAETWRRIAADDDVRCVVLTGAGERVFCAGMDMKTTIPASQRLARGERIDPEDFAGLRDAATAVLAGFDLGKPLVVAVNGHCRAVGLDLMLQSELRYAVPHASFALEEVARGLYPTGNATVLLPRQIGWVHAMELLLTARPIDAARAAAIGLVNEVVPPESCCPGRSRRRGDRRQCAPRGARDPPRGARAAVAAARRRLAPAGGARAAAAPQRGRRRGRPRLRGEAPAGLEGPLAPIRGWREAPRRGWGWGALRRMARLRRGVGGWRPARGVREQGGARRLGSAGFRLQAPQPHPLPSSVLGSALFALVSTLGERRPSFPPADHPR